MKTQVSKAINDLEEGIFGSPIWLYLAWQEIKMRYRRSMIGPFWITLSTGVMIAAMGPLYGRLLNQPLSAYFQHLSISFVIWIFLSGYLNEVCTAFITAESFIKQVKLPYSIFILKVLAKNFMMFLHNLVIVFIVLVFFPPADWAMVPGSLVGFVLLVGNMFWMGIFLAILCTRYRDIPQVVASLVQVLFFLTPIMWQANMLGNRRFIADWNLLYHLIDIVRAPLLGTETHLLSWFVVCGSMVVGSLCSFALYVRYRSRISFWV